MLLKILSYPRAILGTIFVGIYTITYSAVAILATMLIPGRKLQDWILLNWASVLMRIFSIEVTVKGRENLSPEGVLFIFNHASLFDIPIFHAAIHKTARFGAKIELFKIPFFSMAMRKFGVLPIARGEREKVLKLYEESIEHVRRGVSFVLAAEGTRQDVEGVGDKFKSGPFIFAIQGQFPIQPVVIKGASKVLPKSGWVAGWGRWHNPVTVTILPPVPTQGLTLEDRETLKQSVREMMTKAYAQA